MVVGSCPRAPAGGDLPARVVPPQRLRLRVLGPADHRGPDRGRGAPATSSAGSGDRRAPDRRLAYRDGIPHHLERPVPPARPGAPGVRAPALEATSRAGAGPRDGMDPPASGGRRIVGRDPAALGVLADGSGPDGIPARTPGDEG